MSKNNKTSKKRVYSFREGVARSSRATMNRTISALDELTDAGSRSSAPRVRKKRFIFLKFVAIMALIAILLLAAFSNRTLDIDRQTVTIPGLSSDLEGYTILFISDLNGKNFGENQATLLRSISTSTTYDAVVLGDDMVGKGGNAEPLYQLVNGLGTKKPIYFCCGDSDPGPYVDEPRVQGMTRTLSQTVLADWIVNLTSVGCTYIDAPFKVTRGNGTIWFSPANMLCVNAETYLDEVADQKEQEEEGMLLGLDADYNSLPYTTYRYMLANRLAEAAADMAAEDIHIVLSHVPPADSLIETCQINRGEDSSLFLNAPDLFLSGHYCNGVWRFPLIGTLYVPSTLSPRNGWFPAQEITQGMRTISGASLYVTGGLSTTSSVKLPFRLLNRPQISLITLSGQLPESILR